MSTRDEAIDLLLAVAAPALELFPRTYLVDLRADFRRRGLQRAVRERDTAALFDWLMDLASQQGISDRNAYAFIDRHGNVGWRDIEAALASEPPCGRLCSYWSFHNCGYRKGVRTCAEPALLPSCPLPKHDLRKGGLNQAAYSLFLFMWDVCDGDFVGWIDARLASADPGAGAPGLGRAMVDALLEPLGNVYGMSDKLWSMALANLLLGGDPGRERWVSAGASMIAVDTLVHNFLARTGVLRRADAQHPYGPACYASGGCADLIEAAAMRIDAAAIHPANPPFFPRLLQHAAWFFCSENGLGICNGNQIDDRARCRQRSCPAYLRCDRVALQSN